MRFRRLKENGAVLIYVLWVIGILSVFAVNIGMVTRQKILLLSRLEKRSQLNFIADSGVRKSIAVLKNYRDINGGDYSAHKKSVYHNNKTQFRDQELGKGAFDVSYTMASSFKNENKEYYGVVDEQGKLNINFATRDELKRLCRILGANQKKATDLTNAILDWREHEKRTLTGFYSDEYYENLKYPYENKSDLFEVLDELLLVKWVDSEDFNDIIRYITIYGNGAVNINTASKPVLIALGFGEEFSNTFVTFRRGEDGIESTGDDVVFANFNEFINKLSQGLSLKPRDLRVVDQLKIKNKLVFRSYHYSMTSKSYMENSEENKVITCVYNMKDNKIEYWKEYWGAQ